MKLDISDPALKVDGLTFVFCRDGKILMIPANGCFHYTVHPGWASEVIDIHRTDERLPRTDPKRYRTLAVLPKSAVDEELRAIPPDFLSESIDLWRPLRLGWMIRRGLGIGAHLPNESQLRGLGKISIRKGPFSCSEPVKGCLRPPRFYEDAVWHPNSAYLLFDCKRKCRFPTGLMITYQGKDDQVHMIWAKVGDVLRWARRWEPVFEAAWTRLRQSG